MAKKTDKNFTRGKIVHALAEIIYSGQIRLGDDVRMDDLLNLLDDNTDLPLRKNIESVRTALHYLIGRIN